MPPKAGKKGSAKKPNAAGVAVTNKNWEAGLTREQFEEDSWQACVSLVVGRSEEDEELIQALALAVQQPQRKLFSLLTWDVTLTKIHELGNPKAKKPDNVPVFYEVMEPAKVLLDAGEEIPCDLVAKILKFQLLQIKASDQQRREAEKAAEEKSKAGPVSAGKDKGATKAPDKKGKSPPSPEGFSKEKTKLKRRDDVDPPNFIGDEPDDGPQHYILMLGFNQSHLIVALDAIGVHIANVIKLNSKHRQTCEVRQGQQISEGNEQSQRTSPALDDSACAEQAAQASRLDLFWSTLTPALDNMPQDSKLHNVAQLSYTVQDLLPSLHPHDPEAVLQLGTQIFEGVSSLIYDCLDWRRQHQYYLDHIKLINVPTVMWADSQSTEDVVTPLPVTPHSKRKSVWGESPPDQEMDLPPLSTDVDMRYYSNLLDMIPPEACSVPLILHCMLEQVVISTEETVSKQPPTDEKPTAPNGPWLDCQLVSYMLRSFLPLLHRKEERNHMLNKLLTVVQNEEDKKRLVEEFGAEETQKKPEHPLVIRHHDERALRLRDISAVQGFDPAEVEVFMMSLSPVSKLICSVTQSRKSDLCWMALKQQLQHYCTDGQGVVSWPEVERLFHQSVFETMPLTRLDQKGVLLNAAGPQGIPEAAQQQTPTVIPWDDPLSFAKQQLHNLHNKGPTFLTEDPGNTEQFSGRVHTHLTLADIQSFRLRSLYDWHYAEHHSASVFPQVLQSASEEYCCLDTFRGSHNNILYIFCHNPRSPNRQSKESWDAALHTDVKFRKYLEHVADTIVDWTREEELKREAIQLRNLSRTKSPNDEKATDSAVEGDTLEPVIRKDSLKAWKLEQEQLKVEEEVAKKSKKENTPKGKQQKEEKSTDGKENKTLSGGKKSRAETRGNSAKTPRESIPTTIPAEEENKDLHQTEDFTGFTGYNMDGKLVHVSGCLQYLFPTDGGRITVENISYVRGSSLMKIAVKKDGHQFYTHINQVAHATSPSQPNSKETDDKKEDFKVSEPVEMKRVKQGSLSAVLNNGIHLSYSFYGPSGEYIVSSHGAEGGSTEASTLQIPRSYSTQPAKGADTDSFPSMTHTPSSQKHRREPQSEVCEGQPALPSNPFNSLNLSVPNGLLLQFSREDRGMFPGEQDILVRQSFPLHNRGELRQLQDPSLSKELSRVVTSQGAVIRYMRDGSTEVLFADGSVSFSQDSGPVWVPDSEVEEGTTPHDEDNKKERSAEEEAETQRGCWVTTTPSGGRICTVGTTHEHIPTSPLLAFKATDPFTHQVMLSREDLVVSVQNPDGSMTVEHADGTRITSLYQDRPPNAGEQPDGVTLNARAGCVCGCIECVCVTRCADSIVGEKSCRDEPREASEREDSCTKSNECKHVGDEMECAENTLDKNVEERVLVAENGMMGACQSDKESLLAKEQVVLVEKEGCATVVMYPDRHTAHVFLADGTVITGSNHGAYEVFPSKIGLLQIHSDGKCVYSSDLPVTPSPKGGAPTNHPGSYTFSHTDRVVCDITDLDGNHFQVMEDGQVSVENFSPAPSTFKQDEEELEEEEDREVTRVVKQREHCPRLFLVHEDGSGTELLNSQTVEELLYHAYSDHTIALLKEPLPDTRDEFGITILKPSHSSVWSQWILEKQNPDITPPNLRNRSWHDFPRVEKKTPGPQFGTNMGLGLTLKEKSIGFAASHQPVRSCPKVLEMRELCQYRPFNRPLKNTMDTRLKDYIESLMEREQRSEEMKVKDPRTEEESAHSSDLLNLVLSFAEEEDADNTFDKRTSVDIGSLYNRGVGAKDVPSDLSEETLTVASDSDSISNGKELKWTEKLAQYRLELCEEKACRVALTRKNIVPYFHKENISLYQDLLQQQTPDMRRRSIDLPPIPRSDSAEAFLKDAPQEDTPRPLNPTPSRSASHAAGSGRTPERRPTNPTPQSAGESSPRGSSGPYKSVQVDVTGKPRRTKVRLPTSILRSKPHSVPNQQFLSVDEPVRRKCRTVSLTDPNVVMRGFQLLPSSVDFGTVQEGTSSSITVVMKNVGVDSCRFHVKQPPPVTGLRVIYNPGPVAAGLHVELQLQLFAMCATQAGEAEPKKYISQDIVIHTETDIFYLPVTATILPERSYDIWLKDHASAHKKKGLPVSQGVRRR